MLSILPPISMKNLDNNIWQIHSRKWNSLSFSTYVIYVEKCNNQRISRNFAASYPANFTIPRCQIFKLTFAPIVYMIVMLFTTAISSVNLVPDVEQSREQFINDAFLNQRLQKFHSSNGNLSVIWWPVAFISG